MLSSRPDNGYASYYDKMTTYFDLVSGPALTKFPGTKIRQFNRPVEALPDDVFLFHDTAAVRTGTLAANARFSGQKIAVVGLGGTGSYIFDMVAKCRVAEIHLFDADSFAQHNAFRAPGAASESDVLANQAKVSHFEKVYSQFRRGVFPHVEYLREENLGQLTGMDFVFLAVDKGPPRGVIASWLINHEIPFVDVGMGLLLSDTDQIYGRCRVTFWKPGQPSVLPMLPTEEATGDDEYKTAIQTVEMNVLNAALGVLRWKRHLGFYRDERTETELLYNLSLQSFLVDGDS